MCVLCFCYDFFVTDHDKMYHNTVNASLGALYLESDISGYPGARARPCSEFEQFHGRKFDLEPKYSATFGMKLAIKE